MDHSTHNAMGYSFLGTMLLWISILLSVYLFGAYAVRFINRKRIARFDIVSEWIGHGLHPFGMVAMGLVMVGTIHTFGPWWIWSIGYTACGLVFVWRILTKRYRILSWDVIHIVLNGAMAYMFVPNFWWPITVAFLAFYAWFLWMYGRDTYLDLTTEGVKERGLVFLSNSGHLAMGIAMVAMFLVMQWPGSFQATSDAPCVETMPGMTMCPTTPTPSHDHH